MSLPPAGSASARIRGRSEMLAVLRKGTRLTGRLVVVSVLPRQGGSRQGFVASRAVGNAVARNRARRVMREAWRTLPEGPEGGYDLVFIARPQIREAGMLDVRTDMARLLESGEVR